MIKNILYTHTAVAQRSPHAEEPHRFFSGDKMTQMTQSPQPHAPSRAAWVIWVTRSAMTQMTQNRQPTAWGWRGVRLRGHDPNDPKPQAPRTRWPSPADSRQPAPACPLPACTRLRARGWRRGGYRAQATPGASYGKGRKKFFIFCKKSQAPCTLASHELSVLAFRATRNQSHRKTSASNL